MIYTIGSDETRTIPRSWLQRARRESVNTGDSGTLKGPMEQDSFRAGNEENRSDFETTYETFD